MSNCLSFTTDPVRKPQKIRPCWVSTTPFLLFISDKRTTSFTLAQYVPSWTTCQKSKALILLIIFFKAAPPAMTLTRTRVKETTINFLHFTHVFCRSTVPCSWGIVIALTFAPLHIYNLHLHFVQHLHLTLHVKLASQHNSRKTCRKIRKTKGIFNIMSSSPSMSANQALTQ